MLGFSFYNDEALPYYNYYETMVIADYATKHSNVVVVFDREVPQERDCKCLDKCRKTALKYLSLYREI